MAGGYLGPRQARRIAVKKQAGARRAWRVAIAGLVLLALTLAHTILTLAGVI